MGRMRALMTHLIRARVSSKEPWVSIHDMYITDIVIGDDSVKFCFADGFNLVDNGQLIRTGPGDIEFLGCGSENFICDVIQGRGPWYFGKLISLEKLRALLSKGKYRLEINVELYASNQMYWRGYLIPSDQHKRLFTRRHNQVVTIEAEYFPMKYSWV